MLVIELYAFNLICEIFLAALYGVALNTLIRRYVSHLSPKFFYESVCSYM